MRVVLQRVTEASVKINGSIKANIEKGLLLLLGIESEDRQEDIDWLIQKIINLRIFEDEEGKMNLSLQNVNGEILVISQFTLFASTKKGNRPSFIKAAKPEVAIPLYEQFLQKIKSVSTSKVNAGEFGADMKVSLCNDGPVTILIDSKNRE
ncbi:D-aminoacyl-tRNA deacylase [Crocinitomicaceae bacterium]|nr:D-aminoacyl-tRNA deacylase [Crocinitomicaceae bacterium]